MTRKWVKVVAVAIAFGFVLETSFAPGVAPGIMSEASAFGRGGGFHGFGGGGFHGFGGGFHGFGGGFHGFYGFGGLRGFGHFGGFRGGRFGHFGHYGHFGHFGHYGRHFGRHFGGGRYATGHYGGRQLATGHFHGQRLGHAGGHIGRAALAHNALAGRGASHMHGDHGFDHRGFNGNAFGAAGAWNDWGDNLWGGGWYDWSDGWGYWADSVYWPFLYGDALTYALWPYDYFDPFFAYGYDALLASVFWPGPMSAPYIGENTNLWDIYGAAPTAEDRGFVSRYRGRHHRHRRFHARQVARDNARPATLATTVEAGACSGLAPGVAYLPVDQIEKAVRPTEAQAVLLNDLKSALAQADNALLAFCTKEIPLTPVGRLDAMTQRIEAMKKSVQMLREPLAKFYDSLDPQQKERFAAIGASRRAGARQAIPTKELGGLCSPQTQNFATPPLQRIEEAINPTEQQKSALDALKTASTAAAKDLEASCPAETAKTVSERLDMVATRLDALAKALATVKPALSDFYNSLTDEQKARFNVIGSGAPKTAP